VGAEGQLSNPAPRGSTGQSQRRLKPAEIDQLLTAFTAGQLVNDIAARFGVSRTTVIGHVTRRGLPRRSDGWSATDLRAAANLYADGHSLAAVGRRFGVNSMTVANRFRQAGLPVRPRRGWA
jgi:DNA-binding CsgD family transcriptional regulator